MTSISSLLREAFVRHGHDIALIDDAGSITYAEFATKVARYAATVREWNVQRGAPVGLIASKSIDAVAAYFGAMQAGACVCFIEPALSPDAIADQMDAVGMRDLVVDSASRKRFSALPGKRVRDLDALASEGAFIEPDLGADDRAMLLFTSGSTGRPKGVLLAHRGLVCNALGVLSHTGTNRHDRLLHVMPLHHTNGVNNQLIVPFLAGASVHLVDRFRADDTVERLRTGAFAYMTGVPTMYARMIPHVFAGERFPNLRFLRCGSAPITPSLHEQIEASFGVPLVVSYGLSEATCTSTMNPPAARRIGTIGTVLAGQTLRLFDPRTEREAKPGDEGEIRIGGTALMEGYLGAGVEQPIVDGWLRTGDLGRFDADGYLSITGRIKDVIIRGGENISPALIERHLATHPAVRDSCIVGAAHEDLGEVPVAFIVLKDGQALDSDALSRFVRDALSRNCVPAAFHVLHAFPTNAVGKVDRKALRARLQRDLAPSPCGCAPTNAIG